MAIKRVKRRKKVSSRRKKARKNPARKRRRVSARRKKARKNPARKRKVTARKRKRSVKRKSYRRNPAKGASKKRRKGRSPYSLKSIRAARRSIKAVTKSKNKRSRAKGYKLRYAMKSNPGAMLDALKQVVPIAATFYGTKFVSTKLASLGPVAGVLGKLPMGGKLSAPILSGVVLAGVHYGTKKGALKKQRTGMMLGAAFALVDSVFAAFAPANVASMFGVQAVGEYFPMSDYVAQSDYVAMEGYDQEPQQLHEVWGTHGISEELGMAEDFGSLSPNW